MQKDRKTGIIREEALNGYLLSGRWLVGLYVFAGSLALLTELTSGGSNTPADFSATRIHEGCVTKVKPMDRRGGFRANSSVLVDFDVLGQRTVEANDNQAYVLEASVAEGDRVELVRTLRQKTTLGFVEVIRGRLGRLLERRSRTQKSITVSNTYEETIALRTVVAGGCLY